MTPTPKIGKFGKEVSLAPMSTLFDILIWQLYQFFCTHRGHLFWPAGRKILHEDWQHCSPLEAGGGAWAEQVGGAVLSVIIQQVGGAARRRRQAGLPILRLLRGVPEQSQDISKRTNPYKF
jgi:hypothetical protein